MLPGSQVYTADVPHVVVHKATIYLKQRIRTRRLVEIGALNDLARRGGGLGGRQD